MSNMDPKAEVQMVDELPILALKYNKDKNVCYITDVLESMEDDVVSTIYTHELFRATICVRTLSEDKYNKLITLIYDTGVDMWDVGNGPLNKEDGAWSYLVFDEPTWSLSIEWNNTGGRHIVLDNFDDFCAKARDYIDWKKDREDKS